MPSKRRVVVAAFVLLLVGLLGTSGVALRERTKVVVLDGFGPEVTALCRASDGTVLVGDSKGRVRSFALEPFEQIGEVSVGKGPVVQLTERGGLAAAVIDVLGGSEIATIVGGRILWTQQLPASSTRRSRDDYSTHAIAIVSSGNAVLGPLAASVAVATEARSVAFFRATDGAFERTVSLPGDGAALAAKGADLFVVGWHGVVKVGASVESIWAPVSKAWVTDIAASRDGLLWVAPGGEVRELLDGTAEPRELGTWSGALSRVQVDETSRWALVIEDESHGGVVFGTGFRARLYDLDAPGSGFELTRGASSTGVIARDHVLFGSGLLVPLPIGLLDPNWKTVRPGKE
jgi:hypothetical protein